MGPTDIELVHAARAGSDTAFGRLVERHQAVVRGFLRRTLGGGWAEADDVAQETFLAGWQSLRSLRNPAGVRPWLLGIAWRRAQDRLRGARRTAERDRSWLETIELPEGVSHEDRIALVSALEALSPEQRACVALCLAHGLSNAEAAVVLNLPLGTVKSHVARGRSRLIDALGGSGDV